MNYDNEELNEALASEYVLGTLSGKARVRYQRLMVDKIELRIYVWRWEQYLNQLGRSLPEQSPDPKVWYNIQKQLGFIDSIEARREPVMLKQRKRSWKTSFSLGFSLAASLLIAALLLWKTPYFSFSLDPTDQIVVFQNSESQSLWLVEVKEKTLEIQATQHIDNKPTNDYELWMVAKDGSPPVSLGLLPKDGKISLLKHQLFETLDLAVLAVSLEPLGGSPTGAPTEVLFTAELLTI